MKWNKEFLNYWDELADIPVGDDGTLLEDFKEYDKGTDIYEIWHNVEEEFDVSIGMFFNRLKCECVYCPKCETHFIDHQSYKEHLAVNEKCKGEISE